MFWNKDFLQEKKPLGKEKKQTGIRMLKWLESEGWASFSMVMTREKPEDY